MKRDVRWLSPFMILGTIAVASAASTLGCSSSEGSGSSDPATCNPATTRCAEKIAGGEIGRGDGSPESVSFVTIYTAKAGREAELVDLAFNPAVENELWVLGYGDSSVHVGNDVNTEDPQWRRYVDPAALHFMHKPPAMAMGTSPFWGTCGDGDNSAAEREPNMFMGPAMFTTDREIFAKPITVLGSHYDMLHNTPFCRGIAFETENVYWVFNSHDRSIDHYNFNEHHGPGNDDHSDGEIYRYAEGQVEGVEGVSSHLVFDPTDNFVYIADTGHSRIVKLDPSIGKKTGFFERQNEPLKDQGFMEGSSVEEVIPAGTLESPSGIEIKDGYLFITDTATSTFHVFDKEGTLIRSLDTGLRAGSLSGFTFGPDGKIWFTNRRTGEVIRIDPI